MRGYEGEKQKLHRCHIWPVAASATSSVAATNFNRVPPDCLYKGELFIRGVEISPAISSFEWIILRTGGYFDQVA